MLTTVQVRNDLKEIRYYYSMKELFDRSSKTVKPLAIVQKVERYNTAMQNAPARLYILYVSLYIDNNTQAVLAEEWQLTTDYMKDKTVQSNLGHATASFTLDVYGHVSQKMRQQSADRMEEFIQKVSG